MGCPERMTTAIKELKKEQDKRLELLKEAVKESKESQQKQTG